MNRCFYSLILLLSFTAAAQQEGDNFNAFNGVHEIKLYFNQQNYWDSLIDGYAGDYYIKGSIEIDGTFLNNCGIKLKGNSSYNNPSNKKSFKLDFNEYVNGQNYDGLLKLNLNNNFKDPTMLREKLLYDFLNINGCYAPRAQFANVYINGQLWGLYTTVEEIDKTFLNRTFDDDKGNLFKGDPSGDLKWLGNSQALYEPKYELKLNESLNDWSDLITFINTLNNSSDSTFNQDLDSIFDTENFIKTWAAHILFTNLDSYIGSGHNYYIYHDSLEKKFRFITWDCNEAFGNFNMGMNVTQLEQLPVNWSSPPLGNRPLIEKMYADSDYRVFFEEVICTYLDYWFSLNGMSDRIDSLSNLIRPSVYADPIKFFSNQQFEDNLTSDINVPGTPGGNMIPGLKSFINNRRNSIAPQLSSFCTLELSEEGLTDLNLYPNPVNDELIVRYNSDNAFHIDIKDMTGKILFSSKIHSDLTLNTSLWNQGMYFIQIQEENRTIPFVVMH
jgi:hypothetical protein